MTLPIGKTIGRVIQKLFYYLKNYSLFFVCLSFIPINTNRRSTNPAFFR
ncbi:hypothetical protein D920_02697 [Enterococcus faecalis 13-SD-W-01]|nr:hypothetical protein D920_02697 [Enterococcus faecalis 13-SD-W-01]